MDLELLKDMFKDHNELNKEYDAYIDKLFGQIDEEKSICAFTKLRLKSTIKSAQVEDNKSRKEAEKIADKIVNKLFKEE